MKNVSALVLNGNATAHLLELIFVPDITLAKIRCTGCDCVSSVGSLAMYAAPMGAVLKCADCENDLMKAVKTPRGLWFEMTGARSLFFVRPTNNRPLLPTAKPFSTNSSSNTANSG